MRFGHGHFLPQRGQRVAVARGGGVERDVEFTGNRVKGEFAPDFEHEDFPLGGGLDYLLVLDSAAANASDALLGEKSVVLVDAELVPDPPKGAFSTRALPFAETARQLGNRRVANIVALGALAGSGPICDNTALEACLRDMAPAKYADLNVEAFRAGQRLVA